MSHASVTFIFLSMKNNKFMSHTSDTLINLRMKKDKRLMLLMLTFVASPEKLHERLTHFCNSVMSRLAMSVTQTCILMALALSP